MFKQDPSRTAQEQTFALWWRIIALDPPPSWASNMAAVTWLNIHLEALYHDQITARGVRETEFMAMLNKGIIKILNMDFITLGIFDRFSMLFIWISDYFLMLDDSHLELPG